MLALSGSSLVVITSTALKVLRKTNNPVLLLSDLEQVFNFFGTQFIICKVWISIPPSCKIKQVKKVLHVGLSEK